ncbi:MAG: hypothetical protein CSA76_03915 [Spirochaetales bacterium]|nr:MAG: hypothetical protein CSA76_03915 [Spirochaetales bacterium]
MVSVFDRLVREISSEERRRLLRKISNSVSFNEEPMCRMDDLSVQPLVLEKEFAQLGFIARLWIIILGLLTGRGRSRLTEEHLLKKLQKKVERAAPGWMDTQRGLVMRKVYEKIIYLSMNLEVFRNPVLRSVESNFSDFYGLLGRMEFEELHTRMEKSLDPEKIANSMSDSTPLQIKKKMELELDGFLLSITSEKRRRMSYHASTLQSLKNLVRYPYARLLDCFPSDSKSPVELRTVMVPLLELGDALLGFKNAPAATLLEALFLFDVSESLPERSEELDTAITERMDKAAAALDYVRKLNHDIPWMDFLKVVSGNIHYTPRKIQGKQDWFYYYRDFWNQRLSRSYTRWANRQRLNELIRGLIMLWGVDIIPSIINYRRADFNDTVIPCHEASLAAVNTLFLDVFPGRLYHSLNLLKMDGKFYKKNNRREFDEVFERFMRTPDKLRAFSMKLRPDGETGIQFAELRRERTNKSLLKMKNVMLALDRESVNIIIPIIADLKSLFHLLHGVLYGNGGTYDTLSNMSEIGGPANAAFRTNLQNVQKILENSSELLNELVDVEGKCYLDDNPEN